MYNKNKDDCPRGFHFCKDKQECVPDRSEAKDKLMLKAERYFFKEEKECPSGFRWCDKTNQCVEDDPEKKQGKGNAFGKGKGPVGVPKNEDVDALVDEVFDGGFDQFGKVRKVEKKIDRLLDSTTLNTTGRPYDHPLKMSVTTNIDGTASVESDLGEGMGPIDNDEDTQGFTSSEYDEGPAKEENPQKIKNSINTVPNQNVGGLLNSVRAELSEGLVWKVIAEMRKDDAYKGYFKKALKQQGYSSPSDIPPEKKKAFFNAIDKGWRGANEKVEEKCSKK